MNLQPKNIILTFSIVLYESQILKCPRVEIFTHENVAQLKISYLDAHSIMYITADHVL